MMADLEVLDAEPVVLEELSLSEGTSEKSESEKFALKVIKKAASLKSVRIDRDKFIRNEFGKHCPGIDLERAVASTPAEAGASPAVMDKVAIEAINFEVGKCAGLSFAAGIPGGAAMAATVPGDLAQYFCHVMRVEQKLAYVYGWQSFLEDGDEIDDQTIMKLIALMGIMLGVASAAGAVQKFSVEIAQMGVQKAIQKKALTKTLWYNPLKAVLRVLGVQLTKETFAKTVAKGVPIIGGVVSGGLTYASFKPGAEKLRIYLRTLPCSGIDANEPDHPENNLFDQAGNRLSSAADNAASVATDVGKKAQEVGSVAAKQAEGVAHVAGDVLVSGANQAGRALSNGAKAIGGFFGGLGKQ